MQVDRHSPIYVAGHRGLIGSALLRMLARNGCSNVLTRSRAELDLSRAADVHEFFERARPEYVFLAAGRVGGIVVNRDFPADFLAENLAIQLNVLQAAHKYGTRRLILFASSCMYPKQAPQPMAESLLLAGKPEETSIAYAIAKLAGLHLCLAYNAQYGGQRFVPVIPNSVYGPNDNFDPASAHVLSALIDKFHAARESAAPTLTLWGSGEPRREFLFADDLAQACWIVLSADLASVELPLNVGPGHDIAIRDLAALVREVVGFGGSLEWDRAKPDGAPRKLLDSSKMRALGWSPAVDLRTGIRLTYDWYIEQRRERVAG